MSFVSGRSSGRNSRLTDPHEVDISLREDWHLRGLTPLDVYYRTGRRASCQGFLSVLCASFLSKLCADITGMPARLARIAYKRLEHRKLGTVLEREPTSVKQETLNYFPTASVVRLHPSPNLPVRLYHCLSNCIPSWPLPFSPWHRRNIESG